MRFLPKKTKPTNSPKEATELLLALANGGWKGLGVMGDFHDPQSVHAFVRDRIAEGANLNEVHTWEHEGEVMQGTPLMLAVAPSLYADRKFSNSLAEALAAASDGRVVRPLDGRNALMIACEQHDVKIMDLLTPGSDLAHLDHQGLSALDLVVRTSWRFRKNVVPWLRTVVQACPPTPEQWAALVSMAFVIDEPCLLTWAQEAGLDLTRMTVTHDEQVMPLLLWAPVAMKWAFPIHCMKMLLDVGCDPHARDAHGATALIVLARRIQEAARLGMGAVPIEQSIAALNVLLPVSDVQAVDHEGDHALLEMVQHWSPPDGDVLARLAVKTVNHVNHAGDTALIQAVRSNNAYAVGVLASIADMTLEDRDGHTAFDLALADQRWELVDILMTWMKAQDVTDASLKVMRRLVPQGAARLESLLLSQVADAQRDATIESAPRKRL